MLAACVSNVRTTVSTYQGESRLPPGATFWIRPAGDENAEFDELEFSYFADRLAAKLNERGFEVKSESKASHRLILQYDTIRQEKDKHRSHVHFNTMFGYRYRYGSVVVIDRNDYEEYEYVRRLRISVEENTSSAEKNVSLSAVSYGRCEHLASVFDEMVVAVLNNLYSESGSVTPVKVSTSRPCSGDR